MREYVSKFIFKKYEAWQIMSKNLNKQHNINYIESDEVKERFQIDIAQLYDWLINRVDIWNWAKNLSKFVDSGIIKN